MLDNITIAFIIVLIILIGVVGYYIYNHLPKPDLHPKLQAFLDKHPKKFILNGSEYSHIETYMSPNTQHLLYRHNLHNGHKIKLSNIDKLEADIEKEAEQTALVSAKRIERVLLEEHYLKYDKIYIEEFMSEFVNRYHTYMDVEMHCSGYYSSLDLARYSTNSKTPYSDSIIVKFRWFNLMNEEQTMELPFQLVKDIWGEHART